MGDFSKKQNIMTNKIKVFIVGLDEFNLEKLNSLPEARECEFLPAIYFSEMRRSKKVSVPELLNKAYKRIDQAGKINAVVSYFDFPGSVLVPVIAQKYNLPGPSLKSVVRCEHKYWSRMIQQEVIPDNVPAFKAFDIYDDNAYDKIGLTPPFWIKPVKSYHSYLAFRITGRNQFKECIKEVRQHIDSIVEPFTHLFREYRLSEEISELEEKMFAEKEITGHQCTAEGYVTGNEIEVYGVVDSVRVEGRSSFSRYEYPSSLPRDVLDKISGVSKKVIAHTGLNNSAFNIEYFHNEESGKIMLLEINPRISQAHTELFEKVHGISHHQTMLNLALNRKPGRYDFKGDFKLAAHFMHRTFRPGVVLEVPHEKEINKIKSRYPDLAIKINIKEGLHLKDMAPHHIDSYSWVLANIFLGGQSRQELIDKYHDVADNLTIKIDHGKN